MNRFGLKSRRAAGLTIFIASVMVAMLLAISLVAFKKSQRSVQLSSLATKQVNLHGATTTLEKAIQIYILDSFNSSDFAVGTFGGSPTETYTCQNFNQHADCFRQTVSLSNSNGQLGQGVQNAAFTLDCQGGGIVAERQEYWLKGGCMEAVQMKI